jgi:hypothetical protein
MVPSEPKPRGRSKVMFVISAFWAVLALATWIRVLVGDADTWRLFTAGFYTLAAVGYGAAGVSARGQLRRE